MADIFAVILLKLFDNTPISFLMLSSACTVKSPSEAFPINSVIDTMGFVSLRASKAITRIAIAIITNATAAATAIMRYTGFITVLSL